MKNIKDSASTFKVVKNGKTTTFATDDEAVKFMDELLNGGNRPREDAETGVPVEITYVTLPALVWTKAKCMLKAIARNGN